MLISGNYMKFPMNIIFKHVKEKMLALNISSFRWMSTTILQLTIDTSYISRWSYTCGLIKLLTRRPIIEWIVEPFTNIVALVMYASIFNRNCKSILLKNYLITSIICVFYILVVSLTYTIIFLLQSCLSIFDVNYLKAWCWSSFNLNIFAFWNYHFSFNCWNHENNPCLQILFLVEIIIIVCSHLFGIQDQFYVVFSLYIYFI